jgi:hypothetical protein
MPKYPNGALKKIDASHFLVNFVMLIWNRWLSNPIQIIDRL